MRELQLTGGLCLLLLAQMPLAAQTAGSAATGSPTTQTTTTATQQTTIAEVQTVAPDAMVMASGSIVLVRGNQKSRLETELKLTDGSILTPGGTVRRPDGSATTLADGQSIAANGKVGPVPTNTVVTETTGTTGTSIKVVPANP